MTRGTREIAALRESAQSLPEVAPTRFGPSTAATPVIVPSMTAIASDLSCSDLHDKRLNR